MIEYRTSVDFCLDAISGKWKVLILNQIEKEAKRISQILTEIPGLTKRVLIRELRELEEDLIVDRHDFDESPPRVEYTVTDHGKSLGPIIEAMHDWGMTHIDKLNKKDVKILTAESMQDLKAKVAAGGEDIEKLKKLIDNDLSQLDKDLIKRGKRFSGDDIS